MELGYWIPNFETKAENSTSNIELTKDMWPAIGDADKQFSWNQIVFDEFIRKAIR